VERVAFLIEESGERIRCMLNPESVVFKRTAGIQRRTTIGGAVASTISTDDRFIYVGGGQTELDLDLLFDVSLADGSSALNQSGSASSLLSNDVRMMTQPIWKLSENLQRKTPGLQNVPLVRFVWGKSWNIRGAISAVTERLENFTSSGVPGRSWLSLRLLQVAEDSSASELAGRNPALGGYHQPSVKNTSISAFDKSATASYQVIGAGDVEGVGRGERLDELAFRFYGDAGKWRLLAEHNGLDGAGFVSGGTVLEIPSATNDESSA